MALDDIIDQAVGGGLRRPGKRPPQTGLGRALTLEDLRKLEEPGDHQGPSVMRLRESHHKLAKLLASGTPAVEAARITGYTQVRISILKDDPSFRELLSYYKDMDDVAFERARANIADQLESIGTDSLQVLHERLTENPEGFTNKEVAALAELALDRIGHGKTSTQQTTVVHSIDEDQLRRIRERPDDPAELSPENRDSLVRLARLATEVHPAGAEPEGSEGQGQDVREESPEGTDRASAGVIDLRPVDSVSRDQWR